MPVPQVLDKKFCSKAIYKTSKKLVVVSARFVASKTDIINYQSTAEHILRNVRKKKTLKRDRWSTHLVDIDLLLF